MISGAGRKRRSSAYTVSATMPSTTISPKVSKPRKSTSITLTTLVPPPPLRACSRKKVDVLSAKGRCSMASVSSAMPPPAASDSTRSRRRRRRASCTVRVARVPRSSSSRLGSQRSPSRISTVVTISTTSCVSARSGAENHKKVTQVHSPAPPISASAASRWYLACQAAATAHTMPIAHSSTKPQDSGSPVRSPMGTPRDHSGSAAAATAMATTHSICHCRRCVPNRRRPWRPARLMAASSFSKARLPLRWRTKGAASTTPSLRCQRSSRYKPMPPTSATTLMPSGRLKPCQTARLNSGSSPPTTGRAAACKNLPTDHAGKMPTTRQASTSSSTGTRIQCGGSCGCIGRSVAGGPQNTSIARRSE